MKKPIYNPLDTDQAFQDIIDEEFNPDIVQIALIDMWDAGYRHGVKFGVAAALTGLGFVVVGYTVYSDLKHRFSKDKES